MYAYGDDNSWNNTYDVFVLVIKSQCSILMLDITTLLPYENNWGDAL